MLKNGLLPIGSVVLLHESTKRVLIVGVCQRSTGSNKLYDYVGVLFPEGYMSSDQLFLFNNDQIKQIFAVGYQDAEQLEFLVRADNALSKFRAEEAEKEKN